MKIPWNWDNHNQDTLYSFHYLVLSQWNAIVTPAIVPKVVFVAEMVVVWRWELTNWNSRSAVVNYIFLQDRSLIRIPSLGHMIRNLSGHFKQTFNACSRNKLSLSSVSRFLGQLSASLTELEITHTSYYHRTGERNESNEITNSQKITWGKQIYYSSPEQ